MKRQLAPLKIFINNFIIRILISLLAILILDSGALAQFPIKFSGSDKIFDPEWGLATKTNSIRDEIGTELGAFIGIVANQKTFIGIIGALDIIHEKIDYGYLGILFQHTVKPEGQFYYSSQCIIGLGDVIKYKRPTFSNSNEIGNYDGPVFFLIEPGVKIERQFAERLRMTFGLSYRLTYGIQIFDPFATSNAIENKDLRGLFINIGIKKTINIF